MTAKRESDYVTYVRETTRQVWDGINALVAFQREYNALDYGNTLDTFEDENAGLVAGDIGAVVFDTANALVTVLNAGHATNMAKLL